MTLELVALGFALVALVVAIVIVIGIGIGFALRRRRGEDAWRDLVAWHDRQLALEELRKRAR